MVAVHRIAIVLDDEWGFWSSAPVEKVGPSDSKTPFFQTDMLGPRGHVKYESADGALSTMSFDCPTSRASVCSGKMSPGTPYTIEAYVPSSGYSIDYEWSIRRKSFSFFDAPVFAEDLLAAEKCDLVTDERIVQAIDSRGAYLRVTFAVADLPDEAKLSCATHWRQVRRTGRDGPAGPRTRNCQKRSR